MSKILKELARKTQHLAREVLHFGHLGRVASRRGFLHRERRKLVLRLGEKSLEHLRDGKLKDPELQRLLGPIEKIEKLLSETDYGGQRGREFTRARSKKESAGLSRGKKPLPNP